MTTQSEFVERSVAAAADLALLFVGVPDQEMTQELHRVRSNLEVELAGPFGPDVAASIAQEFVKAVVGRRQEIDDAGSMRSSVLN
jgi:hypothetical protein